MKDFTEYNYDQIVRKMTDLLKEAEGWGDGYQSSTGQTLIQLMADVTDNLHYMLERRTNENYLETAQLRSSVIARACELGYRFRRAIGNTGRLQIRINDIDWGEYTEPKYAEEDIIIPRFTQLERDGGIFLTTEEVVLKKDTNVVEVDVIKGTLENFTQSLDQSLKSITIRDYEFIDNNTLFVSSNGVEYKDVVLDKTDVNKRALSFLQPDETYYDIRFSIDGMCLVFGDNFFGKTPDDDVFVEYINVFGAEEPVFSTGIIFETDHEFFDLDMNEYEVTITNVTPIQGYQQPETTTGVRLNAPIYHKTNGRAVTNSDYAHWTRSSGIGGIVDARVYGEHEIESLLYNLNNVYISYLKSDGQPLNTQEKSKLRAFMDVVKTTQAHLVFTPVKIANLRCTVDIRKHPTLPISDAEVYARVFSFFQRYFQLGEGSIGKGVQSSDVVRDLYRERVTRNGITYPLIDFCKIDFDCVQDFSFPFKTKKAFVELATDYTPTNGHEFVLVLENLVCSVDVVDTDDATAILTKMRDRIRSITPFDARIVLAGVALDAFGNALPIEIDPVVGATILIGTDTPFDSNISLIHPPVIGSTLAKVVSISPEVTVNHYYYSSREGRRPMIPLRIGTTINFTAPSDTSVTVYTRLNKDDPSTEATITTLTPNQVYTKTFTDEHTVQFEYANNSSDDRTVEVIYPSFDGTAFGLEIATTNRLGSFTVLTSSGDLSQSISVDYSIALPNFTNVTDVNNNRILPSSLRIVNMAGNIVLSDRGNGFFNFPNGQISPTGSINYLNGEITLPKNFQDGNYRIIYDQDIYDNFDVEDDTAIQLINPKPTINSTVESISRIRLV